MTSICRHINFSMHVQYSLNRVENFYLTTLFLPEAKLIGATLKE